MIIKQGEELKEDLNNLLWQKRVKIIKLIQINRKVS